MRPITSIRDRHSFSQRDVRDARPAGTKTGDLSGLTELGGSSKRNPKTGEEEEVDLKSMSKAEQLEYLQNKA